MKWRIIDKKNAKAPTTGDYRSWKPQLATEAELQCVYCCIHESQFGGIRNFHVEHYKPQSKFPELKNDYANLFYACGICNSFKSDDWPTELTDDDLSKPGYPCPAKVDYNSFLLVDGDTGEVSGNNVTSRYLIERLHLNRGQIVALRAISVLFDRLRRFQSQIKELQVEQKIPSQLKDEVINILLHMNDVLDRYAKVRPYSPDQLR